VSRRAASGAAGPTRCPAARGEAPVPVPRFVRTIATGETGWFSSPGLADLDGDGRLEIVLTAFDHGVDVFRVPGSGTRCLPWPTGRGSLLRSGTGPATVP
jgi:hypothetical protein